MIAGGLRGLLRNRGEQIEEVILLIYVPFRCAWVAPVRRVEI